MSKYKKKKKKKKKKFQGLNKYARYQTGMTMVDLYPKMTKKVCACGCGQLLTGRRRRWATDKCQAAALERFYIVKGDGRTIREAVFKRDKGVCRDCSKKTHDWEAHHIVAVYQGGGGCELDNFATLCDECHKIVHKSLK